MNTVCFIGYGSMGSMLVNGFLSAKVLNEYLPKIFDDEKNAAKKEAKCQWRN